MAQETFKTGNFERFCPIALFLVIYKVAWFWKKIIYFVTIFISGSWITGAPSRPATTPGYYSTVQCSETRTPIPGMYPKADFTQTTASDFVPFTIEPIFFS